MNKSKNLFIRVLRATVGVFAGAAAQLYLAVKNTTERLIRRIKFSISFKLAMVYLKWLIISLFVSTCIINGAVWITVLEDEWQELHMIENRFTDSFQRTGEETLDKMGDTILNSRLMIYVLDENGTVVHEAGNLLPEQGFNEKEYLKYPIVNRINGRMYFSSENQMNFKDKAYRLIIYKDIHENLVFLLRFLVFTAAVHVLVILIAVIFGARANQKVLKPVKDIAETTRKISGHNLSLRINVEGVQDELKELAETINEMMDRIENSYNQQQQFVSDASHELRTPIAVLQGYANLLDRWGKDDPQVLQESITAIKSETENMKELVEKLLFLARNDRNTLILQKEKFDLSALLAEAVRETEMIDSRHKIICSIKAGIYMDGDKSRIKQAIRIFMDNAVKYTPDGGEIEVKALRDGSNAVISIRDTGIGIPKEDLRHIFDRFYRSDKSRTKEKGGYGLGLAIAKIIILGHGGEIRVRSKIGEGTEFQIFFRVLNGFVS